MDLGLGFLFFFFSYLEMLDFFMKDNKENQNDLSNFMSTEKALFICQIHLTTYLYVCIKLLKTLSVGTIEKWTKLGPNHLLIHLAVDLTQFLSSKSILSNVCKHWSLDLSSSKVLLDILWFANQIDSTTSRLNK